MILNGKDLMIFIDGKTAAYAKSCDVDVKANTIDTGSKDSGIWDEYIVGSMGFTITSDGLCALKKDSEDGYVYEDLLSKMIAHEAVTVMFGSPANLTPGDAGVPEGGWTAPTGAVSQPVAYTGKAIIDDVKISGAKGDVGSMSISLTGTGALKRVSAS